MTYYSSILDEPFLINVNATYKGGKLEFAGSGTSADQLWRAVIKGTAEHVSTIGFCVLDVKGNFSGTVEITQNISGN